MGAINQAKIAAPRFEDLLKVGNYKHVAMLVAQVMFLEAETEASGNRYYRGGVVAAMRRIWPNIGPVHSGTSEDRVRSNVTSLLIRRGFASSSKGWFVPPNALEGWDLDISRGRMKALHTGEPSPSGEVRTSYTCGVDGCGSKGQTMTKDERDQHYRRHHATTKAPPAPRARKKNGPGVTAKLLLDAVVRSSGAAPREYAHRIGVSPAAVTHAARELKDAGLITVTGDRHSRRYHAAGVKPKTKAAAKERPVDTRAPKGAVAGQGDVPTTPPPAVVGTLAMNAADRVLTDETTGERFVVRDGKLFRVTVTLEEV